MTGTVRTTTLEGYRRDIENHAKPYLGQKSLSKITAADLRALYDRLKERGTRKKASTGLSAATLQGIHATLHHALKTAEQEGLIPTKPEEPMNPSTAYHHLKNLLKKTGSPPSPSMRYGIRMRSWRSRTGTTSKRYRKTWATRPQPSRWTYTVMSSTK